MDHVPDGFAGKPVRAAEYVRMSTEHQKYSIENQRAAIADYAAEHGYDVVRTYADAGISGLGIERREGLKQLLVDVLQRDRDYTTILTYDVSRWGRFQDPDESAHYEFICKQAGVAVAYCTEPFTNDGSLIASLIKNLKRVMAAEYSRELSVKINTALFRAARRGFWVGGPAGYGLRRRIVHDGGALGPILQAGEHKAMQSDRTILVAGPAAEVETVRRIYRLFVVGGMTYGEVVRTLNREGVLAADDRPWTTNRVRQVLTNEKYVGVNVFGKTRYHLGAGHTRQPPAAWLRVPGAFEALVARDLFDMAQSNIRRQLPQAPDAVLIANLARLLKAEGRLSAGLINNCPFTHCACVYRRRFGSLIRAYELAGYSPTGKQQSAARIIHLNQPHRSRYIKPDLPESEMLEALARLLAEKGQLTVQLIDHAGLTPRANKYRLRFGGMRRAYALVGYLADGPQARALERCGGQSITEEEARAIARSTVWVPKPGSDPAGLGRG